MLKTESFKLLTSTTAFNRLNQSFIPNFLNASTMKETLYVWQSWPAVQCYIRQQHFKAEEENFSVKSIVGQPEFGVRNKLLMCENTYDLE